MVLAPLLLHFPVNPGHELHVLADGRRVEAADLDQRRPAENAESARHDHHGTERFPAHAAEQEGAQVFDDLDEGEEIPRQPDLFEEAIAQSAAVRNPDCTARGNGLGAIEEGPHCARQRVALEDAVDQQAAESRKSEIRKRAFVPTTSALDQLKPCSEWT